MISIAVAGRRTFADCDYSFLCKLPYTKRCGTSKIALVSPSIIREVHRRTSTRHIRRISEAGTPGVSLWGDRTSIQMIATPSYAKFSDAVNLDRFSHPTPHRLPSSIDKNV